MKILPLISVGVVTALIISIALSPSNKSTYDIQSYKAT